MNEELQTTAEELETSKEELQPMNQELVTLNQELDMKVSELSAANNDLQNLIRSIEIATIFLDRDLNVTRFTPLATDLFNVIEGDTGRPFAQLSHILDYDRLVDDAQRVLKRSLPFEREIPTKDDRWFLTRIVLYRTIGERVEGLVMTFVDVTASKAEQTRLQAEHEVAQVLSHAASLDEAAPGIVAALRDVLRDMVGELWLPTEDGRTMQCALCVPAMKSRRLESFAKHSMKIRFRPGEGLIGSVWARRAAEWVTHLEDESEFIRSSEAVAAGLRSGFAFPILGGETCLGVLGFFTDHRKEADQPLMEMMKAIGAGIGQFIQRERAERELRASEERLKRTLLEAPIPVVVSAEDGTFLLVNHVMQEITGYVSTDVPTVESWAERVSGADAGKMIDQWKAPFDVDQRVFDGEFEILTRSGERRTWHFYSAPLGRLPDGRRTLVTMATDVTEEMRTKQKLLKLNEELEARVEERTRQVRELASSLTLAQQRERQRIALILHDDLQQLLYGAQVQLSIAAGSDADLSERFQATGQLINRAIDITGTLTVDLSPRILEGEGLVEAVRWLADRMHETHNLTVQVKSDGNFSETGLELDELLFDLVRELLSNVVKHAEVSEARVMLKRDNNHVGICVEDKGKGFEVKEIRIPGGVGQGGFGLFSVRERLALFGGKLEVESSPGQGTRAVISVNTRSNEG